MGFFYELVGRLVVTFVRIRYRRQIRVAGVTALAVLAALGYAAATRDSDEAQR